MHQNRRNSSLRNLLPRRQSLTNLLPLRKSRRNLKRGSSKATKEEAGPPILDDRIEDIKSTLKLKRKDLIKCWSTFRQYDSNNQGYFTLDDFLENVIGDEKRTLFVETVFQLDGVTDINNIEFGALFCAIVTFCMFEVRLKSVEGYKSSLSRIIIYLIYTISLTALYVLICFLLN